MAEAVCQAVLEPQEAVAMAHQESTGSKGRLAQPG